MGPGELELQGGAPPAQRRRRPAGPRGRASGSACPSCRPRPRRPARASPACPRRRGPRPWPAATSRSRRRAAGRGRRGGTRRGSRRRGCSRRPVLSAVPPGVPAASTQPATPSEMSAAERPAAGSVGARQRRARAVGAEQHGPGGLRDGCGGGSLGREQACPDAHRRRRIGGSGARARAREGRYCTRCHAAVPPGAHAPRVAKGLVCGPFRTGRVLLRGSRYTSAAPGRCVSVPGLVPFHP